MPKTNRVIPAIIVLALCQLASTGCSTGSSAASGSSGRTIRVATFNAALSDETAERFTQRLESGDDPNLQRVAEIIQIVRPDILLINEFDRLPDRDRAWACRRFQRLYLDVSQRGQTPIHFPMAWPVPSNTGLPTGLDLDGDGKTNGPGDAHGWGTFHGQYAFLLLAKYAPDPEAGPPEMWDQTLWAELRNDHMPRDYYPDGAASVLRLSSKNHVAITFDVEGQPLTIIASHPTPPVFDGPEDRNGRRNYDEIALIANILEQIETPAVILGDLNADPLDGQSMPGAMLQLLEHPRLQDPHPTSRGASLKAAADGGANLTHQTPAAQDTTDWGDDPDRGSGNLRVDYALPTTDLTVVDSGVFWPAPDDPHHGLIEASDHRLVWVDLQWPPKR